MYANKPSFLSLYTPSPLLLSNKTHFLSSSLARSNWCLRPKIGSWSDFFSFFFYYTLFLYFFVYIRVYSKSFSSRFKRKERVLPSIFVDLVFVMLFRVTFQPRFDLGPSTGFYISSRQIFRYVDSPMGLKIVLFQGRWWACFPFVDVVWRLWGRIREEDCYVSVYFTSISIFCPTPSA